MTWNALKSVSDILPGQLPMFLGWIMASSSTNA